MIHCDFAVGLSRQLHGLTMHSERPQHEYKQHHSLGALLGLSQRLTSGSGLGWNTAFSLDSW
jgi:aldehyde dehydrogenase (NAD+)